MNDNHQNTLPPELTSLIFTFATHHSHSPNSGSLVPLSISHVSRHWRAIALSTGSLWTSITISPPSNPALISTYLTRSSPYPIDLTYTTTTTTTTTTATHTNAYRHQPQPHPTESKHDIHIGSIFALIAPHLVRLQSFHVASTLFQDTHCPALTRLISLVSAHPLPLLKDLTLDRTGSSKVPLDVRAPRLTHLRLSGERALALPGPGPGAGVGTGMGVGMGGMDLGRLTTLHLNIPMSYAQFGAVTAACPALATLAIYERNIEDWPALPSGPGASAGAGAGTGTGRTDLPNLTSLQLYGHRLNKISEILLSLGAPALEDLVIAPIVPNDLVGLLRATQSSPSPSSSSSSSPSTSTPPHSHFPALQNLTLAPAHSSALTVLRAASACFPGVKRLAFANVYVDGFRDVFVDCGSECGCGCGCGCRCLSDTESGSEPEFEFEFESEFEHSSNSKLEKGERPDPHQHQHQHQHHQHSKQKQKQKQKPKPFPFPDLRTLSLRHVGARMGHAVREMAGRRMRAGCALESVWVDGASWKAFGRGFGGVGAGAGGEGGGVKLEKRDVWEEYRLQALFRDVESQFLGRFDDDDDDE